MPGITVQGNTSGWTDTGIDVQQGQWIRITASGWIGFAFGGWHRNPDGVDQHGQGRETANGHHPGPGLIKNSLIAHIGGHTLQAGSNMAIRAPASGRLHFIVNDDHRGDNGGSWQVNAEPLAGPLTLHQNLLLVTQGAMAASSSLIENGIRDFVGIVAAHSDRAVRISVARQHIPEQVAASEMVIPAAGSTHRIAGYGPVFSQWLQRMGVDPAAFDGIFRLYEQPPQFPDFGYWTWEFISGLPKRIGYTSMPVNILQNEPDGAGGVLLHEYLHQLDGRFKDAGVPGFYDPDAKPDPAMSNFDYYTHTLRHYANSPLPPPYGLLNGVFGRLG